MHIVNIHEAKTHLSRLLARIAGGESIVIAKAGKPVAKLVPLSDPDPARKCRIGFLKDAGFKVPDDFDTFAQDEIEAMFHGQK